MPLRRAWCGGCEVEAPYEAARTRVLIGLACRALGDEVTADLELDAARSAFRAARSAPRPGPGRDAVAERCRAAPRRPDRTGGRGPRARGGRQDQPRDRPPNWSSASTPSPGTSRTSSSSSACRPAPRPAPSPTSTTCSEARVVEIDHASRAADGAIGRCGGLAASSYGRSSGHARPSPTDRRRPCRPYRLRRAMASTTRPRRGSATVQRCVPHLRRRRPVRTRRLLRPEHAACGGSSSRARRPGSPAVRLHRGGRGAHRRRCGRCPPRTGFVTEHVEHQEVDGDDLSARRLWLCEVSDGRIVDVVGYCSGDGTPSCGPGMPPRPR